jgi:hypothetical protein
MTKSLHPPPFADGNPPTSAYGDPTLVDLVDALVEAVDLNRFHEIDRLRSALEPYGASTLFDSELRLRGTTSVEDWCICGGEEF